MQGDSNTRICEDCARAFAVPAFDSLGRRITAQQLPRRCAECRERWIRERNRVKSRRWYDADPERGRARGRRHYARHAQEQRERTRRWYYSDPEHAREVARRWREANPDYYRSYERDPDTVRIHTHLRRARLHAAEGTFTTAEFRTLCELYDHKCAYCGEQRPLTADHATPLSRGGSNDITNILPACGSCNSRKHTKTAEEFRAVNR